jgi:hypothetical protein
MTRTDFSPGAGEGRLMTGGRDGHIISRHLMMQSLSDGILMMQATIRRMTEATILIIIIIIITSITTTKETPAGTHHRK